MSLFAGNKDAILTFYIVLKDSVQLAALQLKYPTGVARAPFDPNVNGSGLPGGASIEFAAPWKGYSKTDPQDLPPYTWTPWRTADGDNTPFPTNVATFTRHTGGFWGIFGTDTLYHWIGIFKLAEPETQLGSVPIYAPVPKRRWIDGFEVPGGGNGLPSGAFVCRDASRHVGGYGCAMRNIGNAVSTPLVTLGGAGNRSWERMYVRLRRKPDLAVGFWSTVATGAPACGIELQIMPDGHIGVFSIDSLSVHTLIGTVEPALTEWSGTGDDHAWHRLDMIIVYASSDAIVVDGVPYGNLSAAKGFFRLYVDGKSVFQATGAPIASGLSGGTGHQGSKLGAALGVANNFLELDVDDWMNADIPISVTLPVSFNPNSKDFLTGSKVLLLRPKVFGPNHNALWVGDIRVPDQNPGSVAGGAASMASSTANAVAEVNVDDDINLDADGASIGVASMIVHAQTTRGATSGKLGFTLNAGAPVDAAIVEQATRTYTRVLYSLDGTVVDPKTIDITPIALRLTKGNAADAATIQTLVAEAELLGLWGPEDYRKTETPAGSADPKFENFVGQHNAPYPHSVWAVGGAAPPVSPYIVKSGTYVGTGTGLDLTFRSPVNWFYVRNTTSNSGFMWNSAMDSPHPLFSQGSDAEIVDAQEDLTFVPGAGTDAQQESYRVRIAGASAALNQLGVTYQYIAISDPGMRFMLCGGMSHAGGYTIDHGLINPDFLPEFMFLWGEDYSSTATLSLWGKGAGNAATAISKLNGGVIANAMAFGAGKLTGQNALFTGTMTQWAYAAFRRHDGNNDPGEGATFAHGSWTGDGSASRSISFGSTGKRPIWVMVFPETGTGSVRDVSHTGTNSTSSTNTTTTSGITGGGIDSFSVGSALNTNGVIFNYFVLIGDATAGNGGFGVNGEFIPVQADIPTDGPFAAFPDLAAILAADGTTTQATGTATIPDDITTDLSATCKPFTTAMVNLALSRIGISIQVEDLATDLTREAETARLHLGIDIGQTLRDFPWPFATRYAPLVLVAGTATVPVNGDWQYSYRAPADMLFARRIVGQANQQRGWDPTPITFRVGSDATGALIYTNSPNTILPVELEYTVRVGCPASQGDPLFRSALAWRLASSFAPSLSRDPNKWKECAAAYQATIAAAEAEAVAEKQDPHEGDTDWIAGRA